MKARVLLRTAPAIILATLAIVLLPSTAAAAPPNDDFPGATITSLPFTDAVGTAGATDEPGEPFCLANQGLAVWYSFTAASDMMLRAELAGSESYGFVSVLTGDSLASLTCVADGRYIPPPDEINQPAVFEATGGVTYHFQVGVGGYPPQTGVVTFSVSQGVPPVDDDFAGIEITSLPFTHTVDTTFATSDGQGSVIGPTVWYNYTPDQDAELWADTLDSDYRAMIELRDFEGNPPSGVDQEYQDCEIIDQGLFYRAKAGETIYFQIGAMPIGGTGQVVFKLKQYDGSPELVCYGKMGPPYEGYGGKPRPSPTPDDGGGPSDLPAGGGDPRSNADGSPRAAIILGGVLAVLASAALLVRAMRR